MVQFHPLCGAVTFIRRATAYLSRLAGLPAFLSSFLHYAGRRPCWQVVPALAVGPASPCSPPALCSGAPARRGWWAAPRPGPAPSAGAPPPPSPPAAEPGLLSRAESRSLKNHSAKLGPCLSINAAQDSGYSCLRGERSLGTVFAMKGSPTVHPRCSSDGDRNRWGRW